MGQLRQHGVFPNSRDNRGACRVASLLVGNILEVGGTLAIGSTPAIGKLPATGGGKGKKDVEESWML